MRIIRPPICLAAAISLAAGFTTGCTWIADKERIVIAHMKDRVIRRGDLTRVLREMPDDERPQIRNKGDVLETLQKYLDDEIKKAEAENLVKEGKIVVVEEEDPAAASAKMRELMGQGKMPIARAMAEEAYFRQHPDLRNIRLIQDPKALDMSEAELAVARNQVEDGIDRVVERFIADAAVAYRAREAVQSGALNIPDEEFQEEYNLRKEDLKNFENIEFLTLRFPAVSPDAETRAAEARRRIDAGESFEALIEEYGAKDPTLVLRSAIENNPTSIKFRGFWISASGCKVGDVLGPIFLPSYEMMGQVRPGQMGVQTMPDAYLVLKVLEHTPETTKTLEQAKAELAPAVLQKKIMDLLRQEYEVSIEHDNLPDPSLFGEGRTRTIMEK